MRNLWRWLQRLEVRKRAAAIGSLLAADIRAALVGAFVGTLTALGWTRFEEAQKANYYAIGEGGVGYPTLLFKLAAEERHYQFTFTPATLLNTRVCEYDFDFGKSYSDLMLSYLKKYSDCFTVRRISEKEFAIHPNESTSTMQRDSKDSFHCRCPPQ